MGEATGVPEAEVQESAGFRTRLADAEDQKAVRKTARDERRVDRGLEAITAVMKEDAVFPAIAGELVRADGGEPTLVSSTGAGTVFRLTLPTHAAGELSRARASRS
jgi:hypothetical protein